MPNRASYIFFCMVIIMMAFYLACSQAPTTLIPEWSRYDESEMLSSVKDHQSKRMQFKLIQSRVSDKNKIWDNIRDDLASFTEEDYHRLSHLIYEQDIPTIQSSISRGLLTYEQLTLWYLYRIVKLENDTSRTLHTIIALNPDALEAARLKDKNGPGKHPIFGMPILLKDNIDTEDMKTTAGALALMDNQTSDAHIVKRLKEKGAVILGKVNLSEWAYFFCGGCPVGYSAVGGQTLNPYGRGIFETGGSSAGSATSMAANYAVGAVGTETSGSILSPSGKNSVVGLKPTIGLLSRSGIVPISGNLDTPGPMTRNVTDNAILLSAMAGVDKNDPATKELERTDDYYSQLKEFSLTEARLGAIRGFIERDSVYRETLKKLADMGATIIEYDPPEVSLDGFGSLLSGEMKRDLPRYITNHAGGEVEVKSVQDVVDFNLQDTLIRAPYGQARLEGSASDTTSDKQLELLFDKLHISGQKYFDIPMKEHDLDAILSIDNFSAGYAAVAQYPCLTVPMGYKEDGTPTNLTFIGINQSEAFLLRLGYAFEQAFKARKPPF